MRTFLCFAGVWAILEAMKMLFGSPVALCVAVAALSFCVGALWGAGSVSKRDAGGA